MKSAARMDEGRQSGLGRDQPEKIVIHRTHQIAGRGLGAAIGVGMVAAHDAGGGSAQGSQQGDVLGGVDFETVGFGSQVLRGVAAGRPDRITYICAFDQAAAFRRMGGQSFAGDLVAQCFGQNERGDHFAGWDGPVWMRPTRWPLPVSMM